MIELWLIGGIMLIFVAVIGYMAHLSQRMQLAFRQAERQALFAMIEERRRIELEQRQHMDWLFRQAYGRPRLTVIDGGKAEGCAVIQLPDRAKD